MGSSVRLCAVLELWITFWQKIGITTTAPTKKLFSGEKLCKNSRCFLQCYFLGVVLMQVETTGYQT